MKRNTNTQTQKRYLCILEGIHYIASNCETFGLLYGGETEEVMDALRSTGFIVQEVSLADFENNAVILKSVGIGRFEVEQKVGEMDLKECEACLLEGVQAECRDAKLIKMILMEQKKTEKIHIVSWCNPEEGTYAKEFWDIATYNQEKMIKNFLLFGVSERVYNCVLGDDAKKVADQRGFSIVEKQGVAKGVVRTYIYS